MAIEVVRATNSLHFQAAHQLVREMGNWDAAEVEALGIASAETLAAFYWRTASDLATRYLAPGATMLLAHDDMVPKGIIGFSPFDRQTAELEKLYVSPTSRGLGLGGRLVRTLLSVADDAGYRSLKLETVRFMADAIRLYKAHGFVVCAPFRDPPPTLRAITVFMERPDNLNIHA